MFFLLSCYSSCWGNLKPCPWEDPCRVNLLSEWVSSLVVFLPIYETITHRGTHQATIQEEIDPRDVEIQLLGEQIEQLQLERDREEAYDHYPRGSERDMELDVESDHFSNHFHYHPLLQKRVNNWGLRACDNIYNIIAELPEFYRCLNQRTSSSGLWPSSASSMRWTSPNIRWKLLPLNSMILLQFGGKICNNQGLAWANLKSRSGEDGEAPPLPLPTGGGHLHPRPMVHKLVTRRAKRHWPN